MAISPEQCAHEVLEAALLLMPSVYAKIKNRQPPDLSMSQFRALAFLKLCPGVSLSEVAEHLGMGPPSTSKMMGGLVERNLVMRQTSSTDRRRITLTLTAQGVSILELARQRVQAHLAERMVALPEVRRTTVVQAMQALRSIFTPG